MAVHSELFICSLHYNDLQISSLDTILPVLVCSKEYLQIYLCLIRLREITIF
jgi:hypothetical protein